MNVANRNCNVGFTYWTKPTVANLNLSIANAISIKGTPVKIPVNIRAILTLISLPKKPPSRPTIPCHPKKCVPVSHIKAIGSRHTTSQKTDLIGPIVKGFFTSPYYPNVTASIIEMYGNSPTPKLNKTTAITAKLIANHCDGLKRSPKKMAPNATATNGKI